MYINKPRKQYYALRCTSIKEIDYSIRICIGVYD